MQELKKFSKHFERHVDHSPCRMPVLVQTGITILYAHARFALPLSCAAAFATCVAFRLSTHQATYLPTCTATFRQALGSTPSTKSRISSKRSFVSCFTLLLIGTLRALFPWHCPPLCCKHQSTSNFERTDPLLASDNFGRGLTLACFCLRQAILEGLTIACFCLRQEILEGCPPALPATSNFEGTDPLLASDNFGGTDPCLLLLAVVVVVWLPLRPPRAATLAVDS